MKGRKQQDIQPSSSLSPMTHLSTTTKTTTTSMTMSPVKTGGENILTTHESISMREISSLGEGTIEEENTIKGLSNVNQGLSRGKRTTLPKQSENVLITSSPMRTSSNRKNGILTAIKHLHQEQPHQAQQQNQELSQIHRQEQVQCHQPDRPFETISTSEPRADEIQTPLSSRRSDGTLDLKFEKSMRLDSEKVNTSSCVLKTGLERSQTLPLIHDMDSHVTCAELISSETLTENNEETPDQETLFSPAFTLNGHTLGKEGKKEFSMEFW